MANKIHADTWGILCSRKLFPSDEYTLTAHFHYRENGERNRKSKQFKTFEEAYAWIESNIIIPEIKETS